MGDGGRGLQQDPPIGVGLPEPNAQLGLLTAQWAVGGATKPRVETPGIDNGLSFHSEFKLRTVIWDFAGDPIPEPMLTDIAGFVDDGPPIELAALLNPFEQDAVQARARAVLNEGRFPLDDTEGHRWPWPLV